MKKGQSTFLLVLTWTILAVFLGGAAPTGPVWSGSAASPAQSIQLRIVNQSGLTVCAVYLPKATDKTWGSDRLGAQTLPSGKTLAIPVSAGKYHMRVDDCNDAVLFVKFNLSLTKTAELTVTSPLQRRDLPPASVARQLGTFGGGGGGGNLECRYSTAGLISPEACGVEITDYLTLYFENFQEDRNSLLVLRSPDNTQQQFSFRGNYIELFLEAGDPLGSYAFAAGQDQRRAQGFFSVEASSNRSTVIYGDPPLLTVHLAGFKPGETFPLNIYRDTGIFILTHENSFSTKVFITALGPVTVDRRGEARIPLPISTSDPGGLYTLVPGEYYQNFGSFSISDEVGTKQPVADPRETCGRATVIGGQDLPVWDPVSQSWAGAVRSGRKVELLCVSTVWSEATENQIAWTFIRSGSLVGWANSDFLQLDQSSLPFQNPLPE